jgi:hypothetical protein
MPVAVVAAVGLITALAFYAGPGRPGRGCDQPPWELAAAVTTPGGIVVVSAEENTSCNPVYGGLAEIQIILYDDRMQPIQTLEAPMTSAGAFSAELVIPDDLSPGQYLVSAYPRQRITCEDTNAKANDAQFVRAACAFHTEPLTVAPGAQ